MRDRGFTLLEALVAFVIAALALGALTQGALGGLRATGVAAHTEEALSRARSHLAAIGPLLRAGESSGDDGGGFTWRMVVQPVGTTARPRDAEGAQAGGRVTLYSVSVTVHWRLDGGERELALTTSRLGDALPDGP